MYYYHKVSRLARWDKPDSHIVEAMESRMKDLDLASERSIKVSCVCLCLCGCKVLCV